MATSKRKVTTIISISVNPRLEALRDIRGRLMEGLPSPASGFG
jgi:hypothetical protein